jgi:hypothetical protein
MQNTLTGRMGHIAQVVEQIMDRNRQLYGGWSMEADGDGGGGDDGSSGDAGAGDGDSGDALGDAGKQAIDRMKAERNAERKRAAAAEAELEKLRNAGQTEQEKAVAAARKEGETEATKRANDRLVRAEAKAIAAGAKFRDPSDVIAQLGTHITVAEDGEVDQTALKSLVDDLVKRKPYLVDTGSTTATAADAGIGTTGTKTPTDPGPGRNRIRAAIDAGTK